MVFLYLFLCSVTTVITQVHGQFQTGTKRILIELHLGLNELNGTIPSSLGKCKRLRGLTLDQNNLTGEIPRQLFELSSLSISLNLGSNQLTGQFPPEVGNLININNIILAKNRLSGDLPRSLGRCSKLENLDMSNNCFLGSIPASFRSLQALRNLDISHNNFTGLIPSFLETIPLENLNISFNGFEGEVSSQGVFVQASAVSLAGNSRLCGGVPQLQLPKCRSTNPNRDKRLSLVAISVISLVSILCVTMVLFFVFYQRKRKVKVDEAICGESLIRVSYEMLYKATDGFSTRNFIGEGCFSSVYRGCLDKDGMVVVVKVLNLQPSRRFQELHL